ncbi:MAG: RDD family protein [Ktedonobacteraceae bacterium]|nr:RDD family protein [Ktedonobacteraceae bacterium]
MQAYSDSYPQYQAQPQLQYVGVGRRFIALLLDGVLLGVVNGILFLLLRSVPFVADVVVSVISVVYIFAMEATRGATIGKMMLGLRVVKIDGSPIGWSESIIRNLLRVVDGFAAYLVGAILIWTSPQRQRLGDRVAKTVVVRQ